MNELQKLNEVQIWLDENVPDLKLEAFSPRTGVIEVQGTIGYSVLLDGPESVSWIPDRLIAALRDVKTLIDHSIEEMENADVSQ